MTHDEAVGNPIDLAIWEFENAINGTEADNSEYPNYCIHINEYKTALAALKTCTVETLKERQLDENGLVPCGCGGGAKQEDFFDGFFYFGAIKCPGCEIEIRIPSLTPDESSDRVKVAWNRAMGYKGGAE